MICSSVFILLCSFLIITKSQIDTFKFLPNLPVGPYKIKIHAISPCEPTVNHKIAFNWYLSRKSFNTTYIVGNITNKIPLDNKLGIDFNLAVMSSIGGWKDNAYILKTKNNAYDTTKNLLGQFWTSVLEAFKMPSTGPIPPGIYVTSGLNRDLIDNNSFPKSFFYGKYKGLLKFKNSNDVLMGCMTLVLDILRPWE